jgi:D-inositol-3-phosphate glycosyltransferase
VRWFRRRRGATEGRPRRVLVVSHYYPPHVGGIERVALGDAEGLAEVGIDVVVLTSSCGLNATGEELAENPVVLRAPAWNGFETRMGVPFPVFSPSLALHAYRLVRWADLVHVHDSLYLSSWLTAALCRLTRTPMVMTQHVAVVAHDRPSVVLVQRVVYATLGHLVVRTARRIAVVNSRVAGFLEGIGVSPADITFLPNSVDTELFRPAQPGEAAALRESLELPADRVLALFVGRFVPKKGFGKLLMAAGDGYTVVLVGGSRPAECSDARCVFLGQLGPRELSEVYRACDLFVLPSEAEGFPLTVQEAMASGLPIVTTDDPGYDAYGLDRTRVRLIDPTVSRIRDALKELAGDPQRREIMASYSLALARGDFGREQHLERLLSFYDEALGLQAGPLARDAKVTV